MRVSGRTHAQLEAIFEGVEAPFAFADLDAMWSNSDAMLARRRPAVMDHTKE